MSLCQTVPLTPLIAWPPRFTKFEQTKPQTDLLMAIKDQNYTKSPKFSFRLKEAGLTEKVIDSALSAFILEVAAGHAEPANILCNKVKIDEFG